MLDKIIIASLNPHKQKKLSLIVSEYFNIIIIPKKGNNSIPITEDGKSLLENAELKATTYSKIYDCYAIATDGGVLIPSLPNWNHILTKRFFGERITDFQRIEKLLAMMKTKKGNDRKMIWTEAIALAYKGNVLFSHEIMGCEGIMEETFDPRKYRKGIWICSLWHDPQTNLNFFDVPQDRQKEIEYSWGALEIQTKRFLNKRFTSVSEE